MLLGGLCVAAGRRGIGRCCAGEDLFRGLGEWVVREDLRVLVLGGLVVRKGDRLALLLVWVVEAEVADVDGMDTLDWEVLVGDTVAGEFDSAIDHLAVVVVDIGLEEAVDRIERGLRVAAQAEVVTEEMILAGLDYISDHTQVSHTDLVVVS